MNDPKDINPHTGQPVPSDAAASPGGTPSFTPGGQMPASPTPSAAPPDSDGPPSQQEMAIRSALETVMDPEIGLSVIDLGLIREVTLADGKTFIKMMLTTPFCPYAPQMVADVKAAAQSVVPQETDVDLLPDAWSPELMPDPSLLGYSF